MIKTITVNDVYSLDRMYQQLRADFVLGKVTAVTVTPIDVAKQPALLVKNTATVKSKSIDTAKKSV